MPILFQPYFERRSIDEKQRQDIIADPSMIIPGVMGSTGMKSLGITDIQQVHWRGHQVNLWLTPCKENGGD